MSDQRLYLKALLLALVMLLFFVAVVSFSLVSSVYLWGPLMDKSPDQWAGLVAPLVSVGLGSLLAGWCVYYLLPRFVSTEKD